MSQMTSDTAEDDVPFPLTDEKALLRLYYEGSRMRSPTDGFLILLHVQPEGDGSGSLLLECNSSSLRFKLSVPKATRTERSKVKAMIDDDREPKCPRHHGEQLLTRVKDDFLCPLCGVRYAKA